MRAEVVRFVAVVTFALIPMAAFAQLPTEFEQYQLELINRARANPNAEVARLSSLGWGNPSGSSTPNLNEGLAANTISSAAKQPLAFNSALIQVAQTYSSTLLANDAFTHTYGGTTLASRITAAGYTYNGAGENLAVSASSGAFAITRLRVEEHHNDLFIDGDVAGRGHRLNIMNANWREVGIGISAAGGYDLFFANANAILSTQDFGFRTNANSGPFITGVAYLDLDHDNFYTPGTGETLGGLAVHVFLANTSTEVGTVNTLSSGGYSLSVAAGTYDVQFIGTGYNQIFQDIVVGTQNVKIDLIAAPVPEPTGILALATAVLVGLRWRRQFGRNSC